MKKTIDPHLPPYTVRESKKARKVILKLTPGQRLEVIVPLGFNRERTAEIVAGKSAWIEKTVREMKERDKRRPPSDLPPPTIEFPAVKQRYELRLKPGINGKMELVDLNDGHLFLIGDHRQQELVSQALHRWLIRKGKKYLSPSLKELSRQTGLNYKKSQVRLQKTRWGSCSRIGTISLNAKLLFFPPQVAHYVMIHELCHTVYLDHSSKFWSLVARWEPDYRVLDKTLNNAWKWVPLWAN